VLPTPQKGFSKKSNLMRKKFGTAQNFLTISSFNFGFKHLTLFIYVGKKSLLVGNTG
jgi:hypothetical protein